MVLPAKTMGKGEVMLVDPEDMRALVLKMRYDLSASQAKLSELLELIALMPPVENTAKHPCPQPHCGLSFSSSQRLGEHLENVHGVLPFIPGKERHG